MFANANLSHLWILAGFKAQLRQGATAGPRQQLEAPALPQPADAAAVVQALRAGGHVIVFRHGGTNRNQADVEPLAVEQADNAGKQRQLSDTTASTDITEGGLVVSPAENDRRAEAMRKLAAAPPAPLAGAALANKP
jgi:hypothetical protein